MKRILAAGLATVAMTVNADAGSILASGHLYGGSQLNQVACYVNNVGAKSVTIQSFSIYSSGGPVQTDGTCSSSLGKGGLCFIYTSSVNSQEFYSCALTAGQYGTLRGSIELRHKDANGVQVLNSQALR